MSRDPKFHTPALLLYLYGIVMVVCGTCTVHRFKGIKLIEVLRRMYGESHMQALPMLGYLEIGSVGLFCVILGGAALILTYCATTFMKDRRKACFVIAVISLFSGYFVLNAYICDDAFITFRTIDNFTHGYGLRWNTIERVQTFTNPLWMFALAIPYRAVYGLLPWDDATKMCLVAMFMSYCVSLAAVLLAALRLRATNVRAALVLFFAVAFSSRAFVEFTSSGLENPLTYLLIKAFYTRYFRDDHPHEPSHARYYCLVASLAFVNRMDSILLFIVPVTGMLWRTARVNGAKQAFAAMLGTTPAVGWVAFSLVYFGFPFPNSYYAKLGIGTFDIVLKQGANYLYAILVTDPVTPMVILMAIGCGLFSRDARYRLTGGGVALSVAYVLHTGGDFMGGRFVAAPFFVTLLMGAFILAAKAGSRTGERHASPSSRNHHAGGSKIHTFISRHRSGIMVFTAWLAYTVMVPLSPLKTPLQAYYLRDADTDPQLFALPDALTNIYQNTPYYYASNPLFYALGEFPSGNVKFHKVRDCYHCRELRAETITVLVEGGGINGFCRGPRQQLIDPLVITDPLLARLGAPDVRDGFVPGHVEKPIPEGLVASYESGENRLADPGVNEYYAKLCTITRDTIFSTERFRCIIELNLTSRRRYSTPYF